MMRTPRRRLRLARYKKTRRQVHQRFRQRIFERDRNIEIAQNPLPRVVVLTGAGISAESGIRTFGRRMAYGKIIKWKMWRRRKASHGIRTPFRPSTMRVVASFSNRTFSQTPPIWRWQSWKRRWGITSCW